MNPLIDFAPAWIACSGMPVRCKAQQYEFDFVGLYPGGCLAVARLKVHK